MSPATITTRAAVRWSTSEPASAILLVRVADVAGQRLVTEDLEVEGARVEEATGSGGARPLRIHAHGGPVRLRYEATVALEPLADIDPEQALPTLADMDLDFLKWTLPSRYCPADLLGPTAEDLFGTEPRTTALLETVRSWVEGHVAYVPGVSDAYTAADETLLRREGVCRDLAHLTATLLRGLSVPARVLAAYALDLEPPDFHALVEAYDGSTWRLLDATGLAPVETVARIATGRDAAEIAWETSTGGLTLEDLAIAVSRA